jgi:signal transduction histidine kinase
MTSLNLGIINLQTLIDNLIEAASIEAGRFRVSVQPFPFQAILDEALRIISPLAEMNSQKVSIDMPGGNPLVLADHRRTAQVLVNLLSNAVKHTPAGGSILVHAGQDEDALRVEVIDEGEGIPPELRSDLFRRFARGGRDRQGAGLGLSVVKAIVEAQQGEVGIRDLPQSGTCFWFTLPLAREE